MRGGTAGALTAVLLLVQPGVARAQRQRAVGTNSREQSPQGHCADASWATGSSPDFSICNE